MSNSARATAAEMAALWDSVLKLLLGKLSGHKVSAEILQVARSFLKDSSYTSPKVNRKATQRQLERLQRLYSEQLMAELAKGAPSVGLLAEARLFRLQLEQQMALEAGSSELEAIPISTPFQ
jgi:hypothetical protein